MANLAPAEWRKTFNRMRDDLMQTVDRWLPESRREPAATGGEAWPMSFVREGGPRVDVEEDENNIHVTAELPGMEKDDFSVEITGNRLMLRGEKKSQREERKEGNYYFAECSYGSFARAIPLPCEVDTGKAEGNYKNGVLKLRLPKSEEAKAKRVNVNVT